MHWIKSCIFCSLIMMLNVGADILANDETSHENAAITPTSVPIVLQMTTQHMEFIKQELSENNSASVELVHNPKENNKILQDYEKGSNIKSINQHQTLNDVEVFDHKPGLKMEKQEVEEEAEAEPEAEAEAEPEAEEAAAEEETENEAAPEPEPAAEAEVEPEAEAEAEPAAEEEPKVDAPEPVAEEEPETVAEPAAEEEKVEADDNPEEANKEETPDNNDQEMSNDEPAKEEATPAPHIGNDVSEVKDNKTFACFSCTSVEDTKCHIKPTHQESCPKVSAAVKEKQGGCYTLFKDDTNITMRGCVDDLAEDGLKYCLTNDKLCIVCEKSGCNNKLAPSNGAIMQQISVYLMMLLSGISILFIKKIFISFV